jgi:hypothetical protein
VIISLAHADRLVRHIASSIGFRELIEGPRGLAPVTWQPTADPREVVRRFDLLDAEGNDHMAPGNVLYDQLRGYIRGLAVEIEFALQGRPSPPAAGG